MLSKVTPMNSDARWRRGAVNLYRNETNVTLLALVTRAVSTSRHGQRN